jgi:hypothetical protein
MQHAEAFSVKCSYFRLLLGIALNEIILLMLKGEGLRSKLILMLYCYITLMHNMFLLTWKKPSSGEIRTRKHVNYMKSLFVSVSIVRSLLYNFPKLKQAEVTFCVFITTRCLV